MSERVIFLEGDRTYLRPHELADLDRLLSWFNDPVTRSSLGRPFPFSRTRGEDWIRGEYGAPGAVGLAVVAREDDRHIGYVGLRDVDRLNQVAVTEMVIAPTHRSMGYGTEAKKLILEHAFNTLNFRTIRASALATNAASMRSLAKCGYVEVGRWPDGFFREGRWHDEVLWAVTREAWNARKK